jgi:hypothetical protein
LQLDGGVGGGLVDWWPGLLASPAKSKRKSKQNKIIIIKILVMINKMK